VSELNFCYKCGNKQEPGAVLCSQCGTNLSPDSNQPTPNVNPPEIKKRGKYIVIAIAIAIIGILFIKQGIGINNSTALDAAKTFTQAMISGDSKVMKEINHSSPLEYPAWSVLEDATLHGYSKHKISEFKFKLDNKLDYVVHVNGPMDIGNHSLQFTKENGKYYFSSYYP